jgi:NADPH:quinone reductase-like Zn-dependent oxidoreductase
MRLPMTPVAEASTNEKIRFATDASNSVDAIAGECRAADANRDAVTGVVRSPQVKAGQTLVSHGAAGNVGSYAAQFARRAGLQTVEPLGTDDISFRADTVIDYRTQRLEDEVRDADTAIYLVGGETQSRLERVLPQPKRKLVLAAGAS